MFGSKRSNPPRFYLTEEEEAVLTERIKSCRGLVAKYAWNWWMKLPPQSRLWLGIDDVIEAGMLFAAITHERWDITKGTKFSTYLANHLNKVFANELDPYLTQKRYDGRNLSIDGLVAEARTRGQEFSFERILGLSAKVHSPLLDCYVTAVFPRIYFQASPDLQGHIIGWFLEPLEGRIPRKVAVGSPFAKACKEFRGLAKQYCLAVGDCRHLLRSPVCLDAVSREIRGIPYNILDPTPGLDRDLAWLN